MAMTVADRLNEVRARIERAALAASRDPATVTLIAVSKTKDAAAIEEAYAAGQRAFGESYAQELAQKAELLARLPDIEWHFIGHLQSNKAKLIAAHARVMHTIDSPSLAKELARRVRNAGKPPLAVLIEVNIGGEAQKHGATGSELQEVIDAVRAEDALVLRGLMTIPPAGDLAIAKNVFDTLASLRNLHGGTASLPELSMGMSSDLEVAIAAGATMVRVGTAIFGER
ncbi:MAG: YggS family pyridoxal phosphate-dependent enzyme [Polyangiaceae bacterium]